MDGHSVHVPGPGPGEAGALLISATSHTLPTWAMRQSLAVSTQPGRGTMLRAAAGGGRSCPPANSGAQETRPLTQHCHSAHGASHVS